MGLAMITSLYSVVDENESTTEWFASKEAAFKSAAKLDALWSKVVKEEGGDEHDYQKVEVYEYKLSKRAQAMSPAELILRMLNGKVMLLLIGRKQIN